MMRGYQVRNVQRAHMHHRYISLPRAQMTSICEGQYPKTRPFSTKTRVTWVLGISYMLYDVVLRIII